MNEQKKNYLRMIQITQEKENQRIDNFLRSFLKKIPKSAIYRFLRKGMIRINKHRVQPKQKIKTFDKIYLPYFLFQKIKDVISISDKEKKKILLIKNSFIYEDDQVIALNKPSGVVVHRNSRAELGIIEKIRIIYPNTYLELVHRLDKETSGVLLIAKSYNTLRSLHEQLKNNEIKKKYIALVQGKWEKKNKKVTIPILKNNHVKKNVLIERKEKSSTTLFKIKERFSSATLLKIFPVTGRTHQIRIHTKLIGNPIALDHLYGDKLFNRKMKKDGLNRLFLHANSIQFRHPETRKTIKITAPIDIELLKFLKILRKKNI